VASKAKAVRKTSATLLLIALFKLTKGILLLAVGVGALKLLHRDVAQTVGHWVDILRVDPDNRIIHRLIVRVLAVTPGQLKAASAGTFIYAGLLLTEGLGLLFRKRWAEYFTIITTGGLIPLELYELSRHVTTAKVVVLIVNVAIVAYLVRRVRKG
jgi:uncharacterized membrane protein (DUF2068 family)